ncbi:hypothetical protein KBTX_03042 [wastewater metagenome]|uniref:MaoC-like domain-containing protein n=2 Tax=unclassified sequences TaxID=12908 RepID=A0A5B8RGU2_9ZZZZ|nr:MaoC family dehydratase [Arhodomonas sp. KWT]QEA06702.1 hypothetical protein KBTEX_03042 [uncultured organism]
MSLYLEDLQPGRRIGTGELTLDKQQMLTFAQAYDPQPFHLDEAAAARSVFGGLVASGFQTAALAWVLALRTGCFDESNLAGIGIDELRWKKPLVAGETVSCRLEVIEGRPSASKPDRGTVVIRYDLVNRAGELLLTMKLIHVVKRRQHA